MDKLDEYESVLLDATGFHPNFINVELVRLYLLTYFTIQDINIFILKGKSLLFDWRDTNETHNIVHVTLPNEKVTISIKKQDN